MGNSNTIDKVSNYKIVIQYDGTRYGGWQRQDKTDQTIQGKIEALLSKMVGEKVTINGSGRTDAGVHALGQVINVQLRVNKSLIGIKEYMNEYLPEDICVVSVERVDARFHARLSAKGKKYTYYIMNHENQDIFRRKYALHLPKPLNIVKMREASKLLIGTHDFASFTSKKNQKKSTIRTIESITIDQVGNELCVTFCGDGFLYHMVRIMMGTLIEIGYEEREVEDIKRLFECKNRAEAGYLVPAKGLTLQEVFY